ncbi:kinase-like domain-containing protein, partial [Mycotypha africana]|uniref:kinase-like domain-containing protein n=1 Tax=Mycotypha africana TaxID=64632 RepID=UPI0023010842
PTTNAWILLFIIVQLLRALQIVHKEGIAHRDLSTTNFVMDIPGDSSTLLDDSPRTKVYLIDFGKAVFTKPKDTQYWWLQQESAYNRGFEMYKNEVQPRNKDELAVWCKNLPLTMARPDHGYRLYRSIQTLPKTQRDRKLLPYLIDPIAEDVYSMGALIWKIISGMEPWPGVFDIDLKALRENVSNDESIDRIIHRETPGPTSAQLLKMFLRVNPEDRCSITEILGWLERPAIRKALLCEWN